jgi:hypothetical protein
MSVFVNRMHDGVNRSKAAQSFQSHNGCNAPVLRHGEGYYRVHRLGKEQIPWACTDSSPFPRGNGAVQPDPLREGVVPQARETTKEKSAKARSATRLFSPLAPVPSLPFVPRFRPLVPRPVRSEPVCHDISTIRRICLCLKVKCASNKHIPCTPPDIAKGRVGSLKRKGVQT